MGNEWTSSKKILSTLIFFIIFQETYGLKCFVGLGNSSKKHEMKVVDCPEGKFYVCVKMFGGGMGDQIRRYCQAISREDYKDLLEKEDLKETEMPGEDPACYEDVHNGREVRVCICTGDKCNLSSSLLQSSTWILTIVLLCFQLGL